MMAFTIKNVCLLEEMAESARPSYEEVMLACSFILPLREERGRFRILYGSNYYIETGSH